MQKPNSKSQVLCCISLILHKMHAQKVAKFVCYARLQNPRGGKPLAVTSLTGIGSESSDVRRSASLLQPLDKRVLPISCRESVLLPNVRSCKKRTQAWDFICFHPTQGSSRNGLWEWIGWTQKQRETVEAGSARCRLLCSRHSEASCFTMRTRLSREEGIAYTVGRMQCQQSFATAWKTRG